MSSSCETKSAILREDLKKINFDVAKGGFFYLCKTCRKKYGFKVEPKTEKSCVFGCTDEKNY